MATTTSATSSTGSSIGSQLITSLGSGSGVDMVALANQLAVASFAGKTGQLTTKSETLDKRISAASNIKSMLTSLASSLGTRVRTGDLSPQPQLGNAAVAKATLSGTTQPKGSYSLEVTRLAAGQTLTSSAFTASTSTVGSGSLTLRFGGIAGGTFTEDATHAAVSIAIPAGATLADTASAINGANAGVTAYVANTAEGAKLVLKGQEGANNAFVLEATEASGDPGLAALAWNPGTGAASRITTSASDAAFNIDGLAMTSKSNTVTEAVPGLNLSLTGTNVGAPTKITFADSSSAINSTMSDFVEALNEVMGELNTALNTQTGDLRGDSGARALKRSLSELTTQVIMPNAPEGTPRTLSDLGVSIQRDGTFTLDTTRLSKSLKDSPDAVAAMFTNGLYGVYGTIDGISRKASTSSDPGTLAGSIASYTAQQTTLTKEQTKIAEQQEALRVSLVSRYTAADSRVTAMKSTLSFLQNQIEQWNKSTN